MFMYIDYYKDDKEMKVLWFNTEFDIYKIFPSISVIAYTCYLCNNYMILKGNENIKNVDITDMNRNFDENNIILKNYLMTSFLMITTCVTGYISTLNKSPSFFLTRDSIFSTDILFITMKILLLVFYALNLPDNLNYVYSKRKSDVLNLFYFIICIVIVSTLSVYFYTIFNCAVISSAIVSVISFLSIIVCINAYGLTTCFDVVYLLLTFIITILTGFSSILIIIDQYKYKTYI